MTKSMENNNILLSVPRYFTREDRDAYELIHFVTKNEDSEPNPKQFETPENWSPTSAELLFDTAAAKSVPAELQLIEENTVPSWLWRKKAKSSETVSETSARAIFDRVVGSTVFLAWKQGFFANEKAARIFYEECRYALSQRYIALEPKLLATLGLDWAYGIEAKTIPNSKLEPLANVTLNNKDIDAIVSGRVDNAIKQKFQKLLVTKKSSTLVAEFSDIVEDWQVDATKNASGFVDLLAFRDPEGSIKINALRHATKLLTILLDLTFENDNLVAIGHVNLGATLLSLGLPYNSDQARATASSLSAIVTGQAYQTSSELAALRGTSLSFKNNREKMLRLLRNHRRAVGGDKNDYERISVLPQPLSLHHCPDLPLVAAAERLWDNVLISAQKNGLRQCFITSLPSSDSLTLFLECTSKGIEPVRELIALQQNSDGHFAKTLAMPVTLALKKLGYDPKVKLALENQILGHRTLERAPHINHKTLHAKGLSNEVIARAEAYLKEVNDIRYAFTPWILGGEFCTTVLKILPAKLLNPNFEILVHLGFKPSSIDAVNRFVYGTGTVIGRGVVRAKHEIIFARSEEISVQAKIAMAAAVQSFISGDIGMTLKFSSSLPLEKQQRLLLDAWRSGIKSLTITRDDTSTIGQDIVLKVSEKIGRNVPTRTTSVHASSAKSKRRANTTLLLHTRSPRLPTRKSKSRAGSRLMGINKSKPSSLNDTKRR